MHVLTGYKLFERALQVQKTRNVKIPQATMKDIVNLHKAWTLKWIFLLNLTLRSWYLHQIITNDSLFEREMNVFKTFYVLWASAIHKFSNTKDELRLKLCKGNSCITFAVVSCSVTSETLPSSAELAWMTMIYGYYWKTIIPQLSTLRGPCVSTPYTKWIK